MCRRRILLLWLQTKFNWKGSEEEMTVETNKQSNEIRKGCWALMEPLSLVEILYYFSLFLSVWLGISCVIYFIQEKRGVKREWLVLNSIIKGTKYHTTGDAASANTASHTKQWNTSSTWTYTYALIVMRIVIQERNALVKKKLNY